MQLSHTRPVGAARFDDPNLVSCAGLVPVMALAQRSGLLELADEHLGVPTDKGANAGAKIGSLVAGMVSGADSISDLNRVRHGAMATLFHRPYAPSTLGSFLRQFTFGHVRQLDAVASRFLDALAQRTPVVAGITTLGAAVRAGADVSVTTGLNSVIRTAITAIADDAWTPIEYTHAVYDEEQGVWISRAEVAEIPFTAFTAQRKAHHIAGRLVVRRIPDLRPRNDQGQGQLFDVWRFHAFFTTTDPADLDTVAADATHRQHAIIEQVHADLKNSALAHMPSGQFCANAAWLVCAVMAFNLTRAAATLTADPKLIRATSGTIRDALITVPATIASSARRLTMHLPTGWQWERSWMTLFEKSFGRNHPILA